MPDQPFTAPQPATPSPVVTPEQITTFFQWLAAFPPGLPSPRAILHMIWTSGNSFWMALLTAFVAYVHTLPVPVTPPVVPVQPTAIQQPVPEPATSPVVVPVQPAIKPVTVEEPPSDKAQIAAEKLAAVEQLGVELRDQLAEAQTMLAAIRHGVNAEQELRRLQQPVPQPTRLYTPAVEPTVGKASAPAKIVVRVIGPRTCLPCDRALAEINASGRFTATKQLSTVQTDRTATQNGWSYPIISYSTLGGDWALTPWNGVRDLSQVYGKANN